MPLIARATRFLVAVASLLVPGPLRADWRAEWLSELEAYRGTHSGGVGPTLQVFGCLVDAWSVRFPPGAQALSRTLRHFLRCFAMEVRVTVRSHARDPGFALWCGGFLAMGIGVASVAGSFAETTPLSTLRSPAVGGLPWAMVAAGILFPLVCAVHVANLFSTRALGRLSEMEMRRALGASTAALVRLLGADVLAVGLAALPGAVLVALLGVRLLEGSGAVAPPALSSPIDPRATTEITIAITLALSVCLTLSTAIRALWWRPGRTPTAVHTSSLVCWTQDACVSLQLAAAACLSITSGMLWNDVAAIGAEQADLIQGELSVARLTATLVSTAAALTAVMALSGIYSLLSARVRARTVELRLRVALGAGRAQIVGAILRRSLIMSGCGLLLCAASLPFARILPRGLQFPGGTAVQSWLFGVTALGVITLTLLASVGPALQATLVQPRDSLRDW